MATNTALRPADAFTSTPTSPASRKRGGRQAWARLQIRMAIESMLIDGHPLAELTLGQITDRCVVHMRDKRGRGKKEIPSRRSFERFLSDVLAEVLGPSAPGCHRAAFGG
jgi:hypothetical protein